MEADPATVILNCIETAITVPLTMKLPVLISDVLFAEPLAEKEDLVLCFPFPNCTLILKSMYR